MTNPNNAVGTNGAYNGRTSVNAFNDNLAVYTGRGVISGWAMAPDSGMTITIGGEAGTRDVAVAEDSAGNRTSVDNISGAPISVTIPAAPASGSRIDLVVAYVVNPPQGSDTSVDNPAACGLIVVSGTPSSTPVAPNESAIRSAITADGAAGSTAYYVVLGQATIPNGTTTITSDMLMVGTYVGIGFKTIKQNMMAKFKNLYYTANQTTTSSLSLSLLDINMDVPDGASVLVSGSFPIYTSANNASVVLYVDNVSKGPIVTTNANSQVADLTGFYKVTGLSEGRHAITFRLASGGGATATLRAFTTVSVKAELCI